jgi:FkbM family methyltransferase
MSFSQPATKQDEWVVETLTEWAGPFSHEKRLGYFVEVGSHDGLHHSNTRLLEEEYGWRGMLIEANKELYEKSLVNRPNCKNVNALIDRCDGQQNFTIGDGKSVSYSGVTPYLPEGWFNHHKYGSKGYILPAYSLANILARFNAPKLIDYLSLDVEGAELAILEGLVQDGRYSARCMTVEFRYDQLYLERLEDLLFPEYKLDEVRAFDACFIRA